MFKHPTVIKNPAGLLLGLLEIRGEELKREKKNVEGLK